MHAHAADFRSEVGGDAGEALAEALLDDWRTAPLEARDRALCAFAERLTLRPHAMAEEDVRALRRAGLDDRAIHDAAQVVAYFNYINRVADALHVDLEPDMPPYPGSVDEPGTTDMLQAAGEAMGSEPGDTGILAVTWRCPRCQQVYLPGTAPRDRCGTCGTDRREFIVLDTGP